MQDQCRISSEANDGGAALEQWCVTDDSSSVSYPARMRIYARDEQHNFQHNQSLLSLYLIGFVFLSSYHFVSIKVFGSPTICDRIRCALNHLKTR